MKIKTGKTTSDRSKQMERWEHNLELFPNETNEQESVEEHTFDRKR